MKNIISYLYNMDIIDIKEYKNNSYIIKTNNSSYLLVSDFNQKSLSTLYSIISPMNQYHFISYKIENNLYGNITFDYDSKTYVLINIKNDYNEEANFDDVIELSNLTNNLLKNKLKYKNNWVTLWESKINYLSEHFINHISTNKNITSYFYYYVGVSESLFRYIKSINSNDDISSYISISHPRLYYPNKKLDYYNPLNFIIDLKVRDIAAYIKNLYLNELDYEGELKYYLKTNLLNIYLASMLYARILYPSSFFDQYENSFDVKNRYLDIDSYENFAKNIHNIINSFIKIDKIKWL